MINLNIIFYVVVSVYRFAKTWNSPQFPAEFRNCHFGRVTGILRLVTFTCIQQEKGKRLHTSQMANLARA